MAIAIHKKSYIIPAQAERVDEWEEVANASFSVRLLDMKHLGKALMVATVMGPMTWPADQPRPPSAKSTMNGLVDLDEVDDLIEVLLKARDHFGAQ